MKPDLSPVYGLVTVDVEPDNVWADARSVSFENIRHLPRFQSLCSKYGVRPTYLVTYSVAEDLGAAQILEKLAASGECEIGAHSHLWETPPLLPSENETAKVGNSYETDILLEKLGVLTRTLTRRFGVIFSHRAGRWGFDERQARQLAELGYSADTSVTPGINWASTGAPDYSLAPLSPYRVSFSNILQPSMSSLLEVPCTVRPGRALGRMLGRLERTRYGTTLSDIGLMPRWLRCSPSVSVQRLIKICEWAAKQLPHLNLMTHSSELSPRTSPMWKTASDIEQHFLCYDEIFSWWRAHQVVPVTLHEFAILWSAEIEKNYLLGHNNALVKCHE